MYEARISCSGYDSLCQCHPSSYDLCKRSSERDAGTSCDSNERNSTNICVSRTAIAQQTAARLIKHVPTAVTALTSNSTTCFDAKKILKSYAYASLRLPKYDVIITNCTEAEGCASFQASRASLSQFGKDRYSRCRTSKDAW